MRVFAFLLVVLTSVGFADDKDAQSKRVWGIGIESFQLKPGARGRQNDPYQLGVGLRSVNVGPLFGYKETNYLPFKRDNQPERLQEVVEAALKKDPHASASNQDPLPAPLYVTRDRIAYTTELYFEVQQGAPYFAVDVPLTTRATKVITLANLDWKPLATPVRPTQNVDIGFDEKAEVTIETDDFKAVVTFYRENPGAPEKLSEKIQALKAELSTMSKPSEAQAAVLRSDIEQVQAEFEKVAPR